MHIIFPTLSFKPDDTLSHSDTLRRNVSMIELRLRRRSIVTCFRSTVSKKVMIVVVHLGDGLQLDRFLLERFE